MKVINVRNVNQALYQGLQYLYEHGVREESRAGPVLVAPEPVSTVYSHSKERVLFSAARDANCFFHLFESLWMIAGRDDAKWLDQFVSDFSSRFAESDGRLHGAYGHRWRGWFGFPGTRDQLDKIVDLLKANPSDRQAVLTMWSPPIDLGTKVKDKPCNTHAYLRIRQQQILVPPDGGDEKEPVLDITVCCRSNDVIWGAYGANAVHFSVLQEYLAARIGVGIGTYTQISNNYHMYLNMEPMAKAIMEEPYAGKGSIVPYPALVTPIVTHPEQFDLDLNYFFSGTSAESGLYSNSFFPNVALPLYEVNRLWKAKKRDEAIEALQQASKKLDNQDWMLAACNWIAKRMARSGKAEIIWQ